MGRKELRLAEAAGVSFLYTSCTKVCSISCAVFSKLQALWGGRLASAAMRITMTLDPVTGIPARMQRQAEQFKAGPGRVDPTGDKPEMDSLLEGLGAYFPDFRDHPPIARVGEGKKAMLLN